MSNGEILVFVVIVATGWELGKYIGKAIIKWLKGGI
jgi:hypothetical protein